MNVLQLGTFNWAKEYNIPEGITWEFNAFPQKSKKEHGFNLVIITGQYELTAQQWRKLQWLVDPYNVRYLPGVPEHMSTAGQHFIKCDAGQVITENIQKFIDHLQERFFWGQSGIRILPTQLLPKMSVIESYQIQDAGHVAMMIDTDDQWQNIGTYKSNIYLDPQRLIKLWLEYQSKNVQVRLRAFIQPLGGDGNPQDVHILNFNDSQMEQELPIKITNVPRYASISVEVKGKGLFILGILHSRWSRDGAGEFLTGGQRIINSQLHEDIAYYFNPGDLKPPLNVYFSGARELEGFEAFPLFRNFHTPTILFTDMRLSVGQFYTTEAVQRQIKRVIMETLDQLGFTKGQLIMNGISMGAYPALKLGAEIGSYAINVAKPLGNLGLIAKRGHIERPGSFDTIFDVANRLTSLDLDHLDELDDNFWGHFDQNDLSKTRLFVAYMEDDDYDNQTINRLRSSQAVRHAREFVYKGFPGRHNDNSAVNHWFINRLSHILVHDFNRKGAS